MASVSSLENSSRLYTILNIPNFSTAEQVRVAYKSMALRYHPDKNIGDPSVIDRFREVQVAYEILSDEARKRRYDVALRIATRDAGTAPSAVVGGGATDNPYMRGMATSGANFNANIYDELNRYAARAAKARTASAARTGVNRANASASGGSASPFSSASRGGASSAYASTEHTTSQYSRAQQEEFRRRERERNAEMKKQREKEKRDQRDRERDALRKEQARQEEMLQQQWQQQQKAFAAGQSSRTRGAGQTGGAGGAAATNGVGTPRSGRAGRSKTPPPAEESTDTAATPPPDTVPLRRSRPASAAPGQQQRGASLRSAAAAAAAATTTTTQRFAGPSSSSGATGASTEEEDNAPPPFSPRPMNPNANLEKFLATSSGTSEATSSAAAAAATPSTRRAHTPGRPQTPRTARNTTPAAANGGGVGGNSTRGNTGEALTTPRSGAPGPTRSGSTPVRANPLSKEDKELLGRQRNERARQRRRAPASASATTAVPDMFLPSANSSARPSPQPSVPRDDAESGQHQQQRLQRTRQKMERERNKREAEIAATETPVQRISYLVEDEAAERQQLIEREELLARQRLQRSYQSDRQKAVLTSPAFADVMGEEARRRAALERMMRVSRDTDVLLYGETMDRLHVESLEAAVRRRLYGRRAADVYHTQRAHGQREVLNMDESRSRTALIQAEAKQSAWLLGVMGPEFFKRCLLQEEEVFARRRIALQEKKSEYVQQSPPRRSPSAMSPENASAPGPAATAVIPASFDSPERSRKSSSSVPSFIVASRRQSLLSPASPTSTCDSPLDLSAAPPLGDVSTASPKERLVAEEAYERFVLEEKESHMMRRLLRHRANQTHFLYETDKATSLEAAQHAFEIQLRALRSEVARLQQMEVKRSSTPSYRTDLEDNVSASTSRLLDLHSPDAPRRRVSNGAAPHAPSPTRPVLSPAASLGSPGGVGQTSAVVAAPVPHASTTATPPPPPTASPAVQFPSPSSSTTSVPSSSVRGSALAHHYLAATGQRAAVGNSAPLAQQRAARPAGTTTARAPPSATNAATTSGTANTARNGSRDGRHRAPSGERPVAAKGAKLTASPVRRVS